MALYRSSSVYLPDGPGAEVGAGAGVRALEAVGVGVGMSLPSEGAPPASSFLPAGGGLRQVLGSAI